LLQHVIVFSAKDSSMRDNPGTRQHVVHYHALRLGWIEVTASTEGITSLSYVNQPKNPQFSTAEPLLSRVGDELDAYFSGALREFSLPLNPLKGTVFQRRVWEELCRIPYGETRSYQQVAEAVGNPLASRAVGLANKRNSIPILIPCHRVIRADGGLGGYDSGLHIKKMLLELEGLPGKFL
jgi:methylated-DNA-[protein]-cysteine S-methyltransferase